MLADLPRESRAPERRRRLQMQAKAVASRVERRLKAAATRFAAPATGYRIGSKGLRTGLGHVVCQDWEAAERPLSVF